jgi:hypothetical protein
MPQRNRSGLSQSSYIARHHRKRTCTRPWSGRDSRERHSAGRYTGRRFRRRYHSPPKDDSIRPNGNAGRHRRHGCSSTMRSLFSVRNGDYGCGGWRASRSQMGTGGAARRLRVERDLTGEPGRRTRGRCATQRRCTSFKPSLHEPPRPRRRGTS